MDTQEKAQTTHELESLIREFKRYKRLYSQSSLTVAQKHYLESLKSKLQQHIGKVKNLVVRLTNSQYAVERGYQFDFWVEAVSTGVYRPRTIQSIGYCIQACNEAIGKLDELDYTSLKLTNKTLNEEPPKAFIAHGGDSPALSKLKSFLEAIGVEPLVVEEQPSEGRSVAENVDWYSRQADCAIILATKGDVDARIGGFIPRGNVLMETGKLQEIFKDRIVYLLQAGTKFPTNISEKVRERFTSQNMDNAFIKIAKELKKFGILRAVKP